jgi:hypothetical protein
VGKLANPKLEQQQDISYESVSGTKDAHSAIRNQASSKSKIPLDHPTLKPKTNYQERVGKKPVVPVPPVLKMP